MRFVQFADVHLDSSFGGALNLPDDKKAALRQDIRTALSRACGLVRESGAELALVPGDLFDYEALLPDTEAFLIDLFASIAPARVLIAPGNHDSLRPASPYLRSPGWPANVRIFTGAEWETVVIEELDCTVTGIAHAHRGITERLLARPIHRPRRATGILLFHGSRDSYKPSEKENVIPFSDDELLAQGFTYAAIGHYHSFSQVTDGAGQVRGAYSGCLQGRGLDETGARCALVGEIDGDGSVRLEQVEVALRRIVSLEADVTGAADLEAVAAKVDAAVRAAGARECDVVRLSLAGALAPGLEVDEAVVESSIGCFHASVNTSGLEADYDLESLMRDSAASPLRSAFVRRMMDLRDAAADEDRRRMLRDAVFYGLRALDGWKLEPRDAD